MRPSFTASSRPLIYSSFARAISASFSFFAMLRTCIFSSFSTFCAPTFITCSAIREFKPAISAFICVIFLLKSSSGVTLAPSGRLTSHSATFFSNEARLSAYFVCGCVTSTSISLYALFSSIYFCKRSISFWSPAFCASANFCSASRTLSFSAWMRPLTYSCPLVRMPLSCSYAGSSFSACFAISILLAACCAISTKRLSP